MSCSVICTQMEMFSLDSIDCQSKQNTNSQLPIFQLIGALMWSTRSPSCISLPMLLLSFLPLICLTVCTACLAICFLSCTIVCPSYRTVWLIVACACCMQLQVCACLLAVCIRYTVLTRHYAPFDYKPPLTICINLLQRYDCLQFTPPLAIHGNFNKNGRIMRLR